MPLNKRYEILPGLPTYGPMYIPVTETGEPFYAEGYAVRFYKSDGTDWVANFQPGWTNLKCVIEFEHSSPILVIAYGTCYLMHPDNQKPISVFGVGFSHIFQASNNRHVLQDQTDFTIIEPDGGHWDTERISWDGFAEVRVNDNVVSGLAYSPMHDTDDWVPFTLNIDTKIVTGGSFPS
jgi:hypothetical protein